MDAANNSPTTGASAVASLGEGSRERKRPRDAGPELAAPNAIPVVDLSPFLDACPGWSAGADATQLTEAAHAVARQWRETFAAQGFAQIVGHGVPDSVIEEAYAVAQRFFAQPPEEKNKCDLGLGYGAGGYTAQGVERVSATASCPDGSTLLGADKARPPDRVESMVVHRKPTDRNPNMVEGFKEATYRYHDEMRKLLRSIMRITACALDLPLNFFEPHFFGEGVVDPARFIGDFSLRLAFYPAWRDGEEPVPGQLRYGEHTDYTGYTILWQDHNSTGSQTAREGACPPPGGLQVQMPDGTWIDCPPVPGAFTVNAGDLIQVWTNDVLLSNTHRVVNPPPGDRHDRISLVFFTGPADDTVVRCLPTCCGPKRPSHYADITAGEHLRQKIAASNK